MKYYIYRSKRIHAADKDLIFRFAATYLVSIFLLVILLLHSRTIMQIDWKNISLLNQGEVHLDIPYMIISIVIAAVICLAVAIIYYHDYIDYIKQLFHRQKLARMILENKWYEAEQVQSNSFFKDLPSGKTKERITHFPKMYYRLKNGSIHIQVLVSGEEEKGVLLELKGRGCRQFENYLLAQERSWYEFFMEALAEGGVMKRLDLAINDRSGILSIPNLTEKCRNEECISVFRSFKNYRSGELVGKDEKECMGNTLYIGSLQSEVYFCIYEKDYEQYKKNDIPIEEADVKNRFEIRLKNERAYYAIRDLMFYDNQESTAFKIINRYVRFVDKDDEKPRSDWELNEEWAWFIGENRESMKLTTKPEQYSFRRTLNWLSRQVAPTLKMAMKLDEIKNTDIVKRIITNAQLTEKHEKILKQQAATTEEVITDHK